MNILSINDFSNLDIEKVNFSIDKYLEENFNSSFPIILYGAGNIGKDVLRRLKSIGIDVAGFLDDTLITKNSSVEGVRIFNQQDLYGEYKNNINLIVCILNPLHIYLNTVKNF
jgi:FlaA1/EpsC-like NDP-sugar epimerase